ncbi:hypothetical protein HMPREF3226_02872 [Prevotella corporis]|uniref:Uncharacterized protein n=1 Tax=Prevotella corporis TaxID=28128 RepID=A0A133PT20_9BACT|nr:hypothetical protein HMPREF3226_02872 [Prevotella corporis]
MIKNKTILAFFIILIIYNFPKPETVPQKRGKINDTFLYEKRVITVSQLHVSGAKLHKSILTIKELSNS